MPARRPAGDGTRTETAKQEPLQIAFHNMESSPALEQRVRELFGKLERYCDDIISARIVLEAPHRQPHKGTLGISISIGLPGRDSVVKREQRVHEADNHSIWVLSEAFEAAGRQVEEYSRMRRRDVKAHEAGQRYSRIARLYPEQDYGFIETPEGQNVYFHRAVVRGDHFDAFEVGSEVIYTPADQEGSMGAHGEQRSADRRRSPDRLDAPAPRRPARTRDAPGAVPVVGSAAQLRSRLFR